MIELGLSLLRGVPATLIVTGGAFLLGALAGVPLVLMRRSHLRLLQYPARFYIAVVRGIPPIVWLFVIFFGLGSGILVLTSLQAAVIAMGLVSAAYLAEIYRGGFLALPGGQGEAAKALGMSRLDSLRYILAPQVLRVSVPAMATFLVSLLKDTTVASTIGVRDVMMYASQKAQSGGGSFTPFILAALLYILLTIPVAVLSRRMDERLRTRSQA
ncbi:amino acid ABC transporter permease [Mangrovicella endophytica]|uniref:amino acid ABC transporter permease n=1 Tax=Mangrovicella endophytica TaxID=2066697 RepID=UPI000C9E7F7B|nr:amino acid ABC transporter permease [Mangrovicella endophytica]